MKGEKVFSFFHLFMNSALLGSSVFTLKSVPEGISENFRFLSFGAYSSTEGKSKETYLSSIDY